MIINYSDLESTIRFPLVEMMSKQTDDLGYTGIINAIFYEVLLQTNSQVSALTRIRARVNMMDTIL